MGIFYKCTRHFTNPYVHLQIFVLEGRKCSLFDWFCRFSSPHRECLDFLLNDRIADYGLGVSFLAVIVQWQDHLLSFDKRQHWTGVVPQAL